MSNKLINSATRGYLDEVKRLIKYGVDVNFEDEDGRSAIWCAAYNGHLKIVKLLIKNNAYIDFKNIRWPTALIECAENGELKLVKLLIKHARKQSFINNFPDGSPIKDFLIKNRAKYG